MLKPQDLELAAKSIGISYNPGISTVDITFIVRHWQGEPKPNDDGEAIEWKSLRFHIRSQFLPNLYQPRQNYPKAPWCDLDYYKE